MVWISNGDSGSSVRTKLNSIVNDGSVATPAMVLLFPAVTPSGTGVVTFNTIPQTYSHLLIKIFGASTTAATFAHVNMTFNNDTSAIYDFVTGKLGNGGTSGNSSTAQSCINTGEVSAANSAANAGSALSIDIPGYCIAGTLHRSSISQAAWKNSVTDTSSYANTGFWRAATAISRIDLTLSAGNWVAGSIVSLYGLQ